MRLGVSREGTGEDALGQVAEGRESEGSDRAGDAAVLAAYSAQMEQQAGNSNAGEDKGVAGRGAGDPRASAGEDDIGRAGEEASFAGDLVSLAEAGRFSAWG
jgi:hypothetical protein